MGGRDAFPADLSATPFPVDSRSCSEIPAHRAAPPVTAFRLRGASTSTFWYSLRAFLAGCILIEQVTELFSCATDRTRGHGCFSVTSSWSAATVAVPFSYP